MKEKLIQIKEEALSDIENMKDLEELEKLRIKLLGKKGELTKVLRDMGKVPKESRQIVGKMANEVREDIEKEISSSKEKFKEQIKSAKLEKERIDVSISRNELKYGHSQDRKSVV